MPRIIVMADNPCDDPRAVMFTERVNASDFESRHFRSQLVERLQWAVGDAHIAERALREPHAEPRSQARPQSHAETPSHAAAREVIPA
ncbi:MAG TPA: hypothetical protein VFN55_03940 [Solirubrobacteraceae bacterium]|nr:hypothetical protein [Solirubrobacteraceae bacterium]